MVKFLKQMEYKEFLVRLYAEYTQHGTRLDTCTLRVFETNEYGDAMVNPAYTVTMLEEMDALDVGMAFVEGYIYAKGE